MEPIDDKYIEVTNDIGTNDYSNLKTKTEVNEDPNIDQPI